MLIESLEALFPIWIAKAEKKNIENESRRKYNFPPYVKYIKNISNKKKKNLAPAFYKALIYE